MSNNVNNVKAQQQAKRQQEDAALNRILLWFGGAVVVELILLIISRFAVGSALIRYLTIWVPVVAVLAVIYYLFQRDFFCNAVISACGILCLQLYRKVFFDHPNMIRAGFVLAFLLLAAAVVLLVLLKKDKLKLPPVLDKLIHLLIPKEANFLLMYITCALVAVLLALTLILGGTIAYYLMFVLVGWLFIMAVYYVVKLM